MLEIKNLHAGYGELTVLRGVDITLKEGEIVALIGPNGAGKSTVIKSVFNMTTRTNGTITFNSKRLNHLKTHELISTGIGYVNQGRVNFSEMNVEENLRLGARHIKDEKVIRNRLQEIYTQFPILKTKRKKLAYTLSGGQQQMLALGRALMRKPKVLLLDEPTLGLSPILQKELFETITTLRDSGISLLIVEQNAKKAIECADKTYLLENGSIALSGGKEILKNEKIRKIYLGGK